MDKLDVMKNKLRLLVKKCEEEVEGCHMCSHSKECSSMDSTYSPSDILKYIMRVEHVLDNLNIKEGE